MFEHDLRGQSKCFEIIVLISDLHHKYLTYYYILYYTIPISTLMYRNIFLIAQSKAPAGEFF